MQETNWEDAVNLILGAWLLISPFIGLGDVTAAAAWNSWIVGGVVAVVAMIGMRRPQAWEEWVNLAAGIWIFLAPFIFGYGGVEEAVWNQLLVGAAIALIAAYALVQRRRVGGAEAT